MLQRFKESVLSIPWVYSFIQWLFGTSRGQRRLIPYIGVFDNDTVLDIGCGTAIILEYLPDVKYFGYDMNEEYLDAAREKYSDRNAHFESGYISKMNIPDELVGSCDAVLAVGVLHHISDEEAIAFLEMAEAALKPGGRLVTVDPTILDEQHPIARFLVEADRGVHVRHRAEYEVLVQSNFTGKVASHLDNLTKFPYDHLILVSKKQ